MTSYSINPRVRIIQTLDYVKDQVELSKPKEKHYNQRYTELVNKRKSARVYEIARFVVAVLLYVSVLTTIVESNLPGLELILLPFEQLSAVFGATVLAVLLLIMNKIIALITNDMFMEYTHLVAFITHNQQEIKLPKLKGGLFLKV